MSVGGPAQFRALAAKLRAAGDGGVTRRVRKDIRGTGAPLTRAVRESAREKLPKAGGLNEVVASQRVTVSVLFSARSAGIRLRTRDTGGSKRDNRGTDEGYVRHPVYGSKRWVGQSIPAAAGWWSGPLAREAPAVAAAALETTVRVLSEELARP